MHYYMLNKPRGLVTSKSDPDHPTVMECFPAELAGPIHPIGRLDLDTEGFLILTDDGGLDIHLLRPEKHVSKKYLFRAFGVLTEEHCRMLEEGVPLEGKNRISLPARAEILGYSTIGESEPLLPEQRKARYLRNPDRPVTIGTLQITEGKKHQVKLMVKEVGSHVFYLKRLAIGSVELDPTLAPGEFRPLTDTELRALNYEPR